MYSQQKPSLVRALCVTIGLWLAFLATPAYAGACNQFAETHSAQELSEYTQLMRHGQPAHYKAVIEKIKLVEVDDPDLLGPEISGSTLIRIPKGFLRFSCRMAQLQAYYMNNCCNRDIMVFRKRLDDCFSKGRNERECIEDRLTSLIDALETKYPLDEANLAFVKRLTKESFQFLLNHEAQHPFIEDKKNEENEADILGLFYHVAEGRLPISTVPYFSIMAMIDHKTADWSVEDHRPSACRAATIDAAIHHIGHELALVYTWLINPTEYPSLRRQPRRVETQKIFIAGDTAKCGEPLPVEARRLRRDLDAMLNLLDRIAANSEPSAIFTQLMTFKPATAPGRQLHSNILTFWVTNQVKPAIDQENKQAIIIYKKWLTQIERSYALSSFSSESYGRLIAYRAMINWHTGPKDTLLSDNIAKLRAGLDESESYYKPIGYTNSFRANISYLTGDCDGGRRYLDKVIETSGDGEAARRNYAWRSQIQNAEQCANISRRLQEQVKAVQGWK